MSIDRIADKSSLVLAFPVLKRIQFQNFRCFRHLDVELRPLTVLIGPNDSGKSAFLSGIRLLSDGSNFAQTDYWQSDFSHIAIITGQTDQGMTRVGNEQRQSYSQEEQRARQSLRPLSHFHLPSTGVRMESEGYSQGEEPELLLNDQGERVAALFDFLLRRDRKRFFEVIDVLRNSIPGLKDVDIATPIPAKRRLDLVIENDLRLPADLASVGVRTLLFFVALAYHPRPPRTILIEEPETGFHPKRLSQVMRLLRDLSVGKYGDNPAQVILTTHSPYLLDTVDLTEDQVLVFRRNDDGSRNATPIDQERLKTFLDEFMLGEVWFNEEEAGLVAKP